MNKIYDMIQVSNATKARMREDGHTGGLSIDLPVYPDFMVSIACNQDSGRWEDWTLLVMRGATNITFDVFPEPQFRANSEVPGTTTNIMRAIQMCQLIHEGDTTMDISWVLTAYQWSNECDGWYVINARVFTTLRTALFALSIMLKADRINEQKDIIWLEDLTFANDTDEIPDNGPVRMWKLTKVE